MSDAILIVDRISKRFGITQALDDVSVTFLKGEVHALMGENGAGKSTLGKVIAGLHRQDSGTVTIAGRALKPGSIDDAFDAGIRIVHQELAQCPNLSVAENLCLHDLPHNRLGLIDRREMARRAAALVHTLDPGIDVRAPLGSLAPGRRQIVQIASALDTRSGSPSPEGVAEPSKPGQGREVKVGPRVIVLDEPTSSLSIAEADRLLEITRQLARSGITIIYVSHRMGEIFAVADRVTVLRDGKFVATSSAKDIDEPTLVEQMIGRKLDPSIRRPRTPGAGEGGEAAALRALAADGQTPTAPHTPGKVILEARGISSPGKLRDISLSVHAGEILGVGGLVGSGRSELLDAIFGLDTRSTGAVQVNGNRVPPHDPRAAMRAGLGYVPEDRRLQGLFFQLGVGENVVIPAMPRLARFGQFRAFRAERQLIADRFRRFQVKAASTASLPGELSGGNQQKLLIARWMGQDTKVLLLDEPTRGIDVGTKAEVYKLIRQAADDGAAVLLVSSEMPELLALSDRIIVLCEGRLTGQLSGESMTQAAILRLATTLSSRPMAATA